MDFSDALRALREGGRISRTGWNGAGQFAVLQRGYPDGIAINQNTAEATGIPQGTVCRFRPYLMLCTAQQDFVPWVPSVSDVLAEDWEIPGGSPAGAAQECEVHLDDGEIVKVAAPGGMFVEDGFVYFEHAADMAAAAFPVHRVAKILSATTAAANASDARPR